MTNAKIFCLCMQDDLLDKIKILGYIPVGLGNNNFSDQWLRDTTGNNISKKNAFYGEYSFHYWFWQNQLKLIKENEWIGFCTYRRFWQKQDEKINIVSNFKNSILHETPKEWENYDVILGDRIYLNKIKWMKVIKYGKKALWRNPGALFSKGRTIRFHFDMFHGNGVIDKAIELLNIDDKEDFKKFISEQTSFNQSNMFICKSKKIMQLYYETIFEWLQKCEKVFGFDLVGYGNIRLYAFLAERFLPYWFNKNAKVLEWPILFHDLRNEKI